ncbi:MAG: DUF3131 domain-containing protein [Cyanobacteria bacterium P01_D01_bin.44]
MSVRPDLPKRWIRGIALFLVGLLTSSLLEIAVSPQVRAQTNSPAGGQSGGQCAAIANPLSPEEWGYAQSAWNYFVDNVQPDTGFANAAGGYPSGTLWDMGNYLAAMNAVLWMGLIDQSEFDSRLNQFLTHIGQLSLFEDKLPNKVYNSATGEIVDYGNNPLERGIGWSALDIGRILAAFRMLQTCHPQYTDWINGVVEGWQVALSVQDKKLYGATVLPDDSTLMVQEGRLGYEEYAARGYALWGYNAAEAISFDPFKFVDIYGVQIPVDQRDYQSTNANNYVVSESYILDAIEFGLQGELADYARRVFEVQKRRYEDTGLLTAVSEDNINKPPNFLYSTVYSNGVPWAVITEANELHPELRTLSAKAAFGWHYVYPDSPYGQQIFNKVKDTCNSGRGYYAGIYESGLYEAVPPVNDILTGNTNGLILEILYYKARGNQPLIGGNVPTSSGSTHEPVAAPIAAPETATSSETSSPETASFPGPQPAPPAKPVTAVAMVEDRPFRAIAPIPSVGLPQPSICPLPTQPLSVTDQRYARNAWQYFEANHHPTGLVDDRSDLNGVTLWGIGDYLAALHAAYSIGTINATLFDERIRHTLGALRELPLFAGELPHRAYDTTTLTPIDYGGNRQPDGNGWSGLDVGRLLAALHSLKACHPAYAEAVDAIALDWSYLRVVRNGLLANAHLQADDRGRDRIRVNPATLLGYEEYAARAFQLWGFDVSRSVVGNEYETARVEGQPVPLRRRQARPANDEASLNTTSTPFILYGLEFGFDPKMRSHVDAIFKAEAARYERTGTFSASGTTLVNLEPYIIHNTLVSNGDPWQTVTDTGEDATDYRMVSTAVAFAYLTLYPDHPYSQALWQASLDLYNPTLGYYEGFFEGSGRTAIGFSGGTNSLILQALLHKNTQQPLIQPSENTNSPWWHQVRRGNSGQGLPERAELPIRLVSDGVTEYWASTEESVARTETISTEIIPVSMPPEHPENSPGNSQIASAQQELSRISSRERQNISPITHQVSLKPLNETDRQAAQMAWTYLDRHWNPQTGLIDAVEGLPWSTLWDQGSAILGLHSAYQLGLLTQVQFDQRLNRLLTTLEQLPLPPTGLPNKAYSTATAEMRSLSNQPDPEGHSGWSVLDLARYLLSLDVLRVNYPEYCDRIEQIVARYPLTRLVDDGWLIGSGPAPDGGLQTWQEGRLGYEQYAAHGLEHWGIEADNALHHPPVKTISVDGIELTVDRRNLANSGAINPLTSDPYCLWGLELGWPESAHEQVNNLLTVQQQRFEKAGILTAVNEDALDRPPYFLYYSVYANDEPWSALTPRGESHPALRLFSTKAAFAWAALFPDNAYAQSLQTAIQTLGDPQHGYFAGRYEDATLGPNRLLNINTNAVILESLLYKARGRHPLIQV